MPLEKSEEISHCLKEWMSCIMTLVGIVSCYVVFKLYVVVWQDKQCQLFAASDVCLSMVYLLRHADTSLC